MFKVEESQATIPMILKENNLILSVFRNGEKCVVCWTIIFFYSLYKQPLSIDFPRNVSIFFIDNFFWPKVKKWYIILNEIFLFVLFMHFSMCQRHITSDSPYRSPSSNSIRFFLSTHGDPSQLLS